MKKRILTLMLSAAMVFSLAACGSTSGGPSSDSGQAADSGSAEDSSDEKPETITIQSRNAEGELTEVEVPYDPERIAILDMACLDILDNLGV